jgi:hypothetical protein
MIAEREMAYERVDMGLRQQAQSDICGQGLARRRLLFPWAQVEGGDLHSVGDNISMRNFDSFL